MSADSRSGKRPPRLVQACLKLFYRRGDREEKLGDYEELYGEWVESRGRKSAVFLYIRQVIKLVLSDFFLSLYLGVSMLKSTIKTVLRNIKKQKIYALINLLGLSLGMTASFLIMLWVFDELSYDHFHQKANRIVRVNSRRIFPDYSEGSSRTPGPVSDEVKTRFGEVEDAARVAWTGDRVMRSGDTFSYERGIVTVDPSFFSLFSYTFIEGDKERALDQPTSIVLTESAAEKYFGSEDPLGQVLTMDSRLEFTVTGVIKDVPSQASLLFDMVVPFGVVERLGWDISNWDFSVAQTFLLLHPGTTLPGLGEKIKNLVSVFNPDSNMELFLQPLSRIHLYSDLSGSGEEGGIRYVLIFSFIGILILLMACINFMNLATARSENRAVEIGIRKVVGANRPVLVGQFLSEAVLLSLLSVFLMPLFLSVALPMFNQVTQKSFQLNDVLNAGNILLVLGLSLFTGILAGAYPALFLSGFQPARAIKGGTLGFGAKAGVRRGLVLLQIGVSLFLIISTQTVIKQVRYLQTKDLGFNREHVISIPLGISNLDNTEIFDRFRTELRRFPQIVGTTGSFTSLTQFGTRVNQVVHNGRRLDRDVFISLTSVDFDFIETLEIPLIKGRSFSRQFGTDRGNLIVNESFERLLEAETALGQTLQIGENGYSGQIVGVMKDFHFESLTSDRIGPLVLFCNPGINYIFVRLRPEDLRGTLQDIGDIWEKTAPDQPFRYEFLDSELESLYLDVKNIGRILKGAGFLAGFIALLGLIGLASFTIQKRTKEIGIRKVMGAGVGGIIKLLFRDYLRLALLANIPAWPAAWLILHSWLNHFANHIRLDVKIFIFSSLAVLTATLITVSIQTIRASLRDPARSLRYE